MPKRRTNPDQIWPRIRPVTNKDGSTSYQIDTRLNGTGERLTFRTKVEAQTAAEQARIKRRNEGCSPFQISAGDRFDAETALAILREHGITLKQAAAFSVRHLATVLNPIRLEELVQETLERAKQDGWSWDFLHSMKSTWERFAKAHPSVWANDVDTRMAEDWLRELPGISANTRNEYTRRLSTLFAYAEKYKHVVENPIKSVPRPKLEHGMPVILTMPQVVSLLKGADPVFMPCLLLGLFAGLRPQSEVCRLTWERINFETRQIYVAPDCTKNKKSVRFVEMSDNLAQWLLPYRKPGGKIIFSRAVYRRALLKTCIKAGFGKTKFDEMTRKEKQTEHGTWTKDVLRHTFCSMFLATNSLDDTIKQMGHTGNTMIFNHYRAVVTPQQGKAYWQIRPSFLERPIIREGMRLPELVKEYLQSIAPERQKGDTRSRAVMDFYAAHSICTRFAEACSDIAVADVQPYHIENWLDTLSQKDGTRKSYKNDLSGMFKFAVRQAYTLGNPAVNEPVVPMVDVAEAVESNVISMVPQAA